MLCIKCGTELQENSAFCHLCGRKQTKEPSKRIKRPNGSGTVYKLSGRRRRPWIASKNKTIIGYYDTKTDALAALNALTGQTITDRYNMTFGQVYEAWKAERFKDTKLTDAGKRAYMISYKHFEPLQNKQFRSLRTADFQAEIDRVGKRETASKMKQLLGQMGKWAIREEIITTSFAPFLQLPPGETKEKAIFSESDIEKLKADNSKEAKVVLMLIYTGMRIGELFALDTKNVYEKYCIGGEKTETGRNRVIPIPPEVREYFADMKSRAGDKLISGYDGNQDAHNFRNRDYYNVLDKMKIERKTPHSTRHTFASMAVASGMPREVLQKILGHAKYDTTANVYVHSDIEELIQASECLTNRKSKN